MKLSELTASIHSKRVRALAKIRRNAKQNQRLVISADIAAVNVAIIDQSGISVPTSVETASGGSVNRADHDDNNGVGDSVVDVAQNNARTIVTDIVSDADVDSHRDRADHNHPQGDGRVFSLITNLEDAGILSIKSKFKAQPSVADEEAVVSAFATLLSEQEDLKPFLKKAGSTNLFISLRRLFSTYVKELSRDAKDPLEKAAAQFLETKHSEMFSDIRIRSLSYANTTSRRNEAVNINTDLQNISDFLVARSGFKESTDDRDKTEDLGLSRLQQVKRFLFDGPAFRKFKERLIWRVEQGSVCPPLIISVERGGYKKLPIKQALLAETNLKLVDVIIPEATAIGKDKLTKDTSAGAKQALSTEPNPKPADMVNQESTTEERESPKDEFVCRRTRDTYLANTSICSTRRFPYRRWHSSYK
jgi:hypothetical protein